MNACGPLACWLLCSLWLCACGLDNGLALTPPMGWLAWTRFMCQIDCDKHPKDCISEQLFVEMAEVLVREGYRDAGYDRVNIDDCFSQRKRDSDNKISADPVRFPHGIEWLAKKFHADGLKLGIYANYGKRTCMGFAGTEWPSIETDAATFAAWHADMVKFDACFNDPNTLDDAYRKMGAALNKTGRPMVYSCSWPFYLLTDGHRHPDYELIARHCNLWRNYNDIQMSWPSLLSIIDFYDANQDELAAFHGAGHWNDPDMLIVGNPGLTLDQARVQMALWCVWSAPLLMSNDLRAMAAGTRDVLLNRRLIAVDQDPLGTMGKRIMQRGSLGVYRKPVVPVLQLNGATFHSYVFAFMNRHASTAVTEDIALAELGLADSQVAYTFDDLFENRPVFPAEKALRLEASVVPSPHPPPDRRHAFFSLSRLPAAFALFALLCFALKRRLHRLAKLLALFCLFWFCWILRDRFR